MPFFDKNLTRKTDEVFTLKVAKMPVTTERFTKSEILHSPYFLLYLQRPFRCGLCVFSDLATYISYKEVEVSLLAETEFAQ